MDSEIQLIEFFQSGFYERFWGWQFSDSASKEVADKSILLLKAKKGHILDWCGGWGRISIHLARMDLK